MNAGRQHSNDSVSSDELRRVSSEELRYQQGEDVFAMDDLGVHAVEASLNVKLHCYNTHGIISITAETNK